jgi:hypothetical protein
MGAISHPQTLTTHLALLAGDEYVLMRCARVTKGGVACVPSLTHNPQRSPSLIGRWRVERSCAACVWMGQRSLGAVSHP